jgi:hypothetical protein
MNLGMTDAGDPIIELPLELIFEGQDMIRRFEMTGAGSGYHHYILEYAPGTGTAVVAFDHGIIGRDYSGRGVFGDERVMFGGVGSGSAN